MQAGFNHQDEMGQLRGVSYGLADSTFSLNTTMLQGQAGLEKTVMQGNYSLGSQLAETALPSSSVAAKQTAISIACGQKTIRTLARLRPLFTKRLKRPVA